MNSTETQRHTVPPYSCTWSFTPRSSDGLGRWMKLRMALTSGMRSLSWLLRLQEPGGGFFHACGLSFQASWAKRPLFWTLNGFGKIQCLLGCALRGRFVTSFSGLAAFALLCGQGRFQFFMAAWAIPSPLPIFLLDWVFRNHPWRLTLLGLTTATIA